MKLAQYIQQVDEKVNQRARKGSQRQHCSGTEKLAGLFKNSGSGCAGAERSAYPSDSGSVAVCESGAGDKAADSADTGRNPRYYVPFGSEALESMIKHEATRPLVFSSNYYQTRQNLLDIDNLDVDKLDIHAYRYVMKPTLPIRRDSPKKAITLILAVLLGMVGAGIVLGRNALRNYNAK